MCTSDKYVHLPLYCWHTRGIYTSVYACFFLFFCLCLFKDTPVLRNDRGFRGRGRRYHAFGGFGGGSGGGGPSGSGGSGFEGSFPSMPDSPGEEPMSPEPAPPVNHRAAGNLQVTVEQDVTGELEEEFDVNATRTLFVGNIDKAVTPNDLRSVFSRFGEILVSCINCFMYFLFGSDRYWYTRCGYMYMFLTLGHATPARTKGSYCSALDILYYTHTVFTSSNSLLCVEAFPPVNPSQLSLCMNVSCVSMLDLLFLQEVDMKSQRSGMYAFVQFNDMTSACRAKALMNGELIGRSCCKVKHALSPFLRAQTVVFLCMSTVTGSTIAVLVPAVMYGQEVFFSHGALDI